MKTCNYLSKCIALVCVTYLMLLPFRLAAQEWAVYDASALPVEATPAFETSNTGPEPDFRIEVQDDPDIIGNKILLYDQPTISGMQTYTMNWNIGGGTQATLVARIKGLEMTNALRIMEIDIRNGNAGFRNKLQIRYDDTVQFERPTGLAQAEVFDLKEWHLYRVTMDGATYKLYMDESAEVLITGETDRTGSDNWFKFGDQSGNYSHSGYIDWIIWDVTGAYAPGAGAAIPSELSTDYYGSSSSVNEYKQDESVMIYPSPAESKVCISIPEELLYADLQIFNALGEMVYTSALYSTKTELSLKNFTAGIYYINIRNVKQSVTKELIIK
ncbi:MAG: T9SS type A sorting domain-containing protein [Bacteroidales bacterium]|nr:T9SS type A sorting domain-containing protein [Bacteroidales bacterium]